MSAQTQLLQQSNLLSGRQMVMLVTVALHALLISMLMMAHFVPGASKPDVAMIAEITPAEELPPPPPQKIPVRLQMVQADMPVIVPIEMNIESQETINLAVAPAPASDSITAPTPVDGPGTAAVAEIASTALQYRAVRPADDYYPAASLTMQEQGVAIVQVCVAPSGKLEGKPVIETSSGSSRLDAAALTWAREALRFTPATRGGVPVSACKGFRVNFKLH